MVGEHVVVDRGFSWPGLKSHDAGDWMAGPSLTAPIETDAPALIQFSSGSTGQPRGVVLGHKQVLANVGQLASRLPVSQQDVVHCWMPPFHDMGLVGCHLVPLALKMDQVRLSAIEAVRDPIGWLRSAAAAGCTVLTSTNLGMVRLTQRLKQGLPADIDLSSVRLFVIGAEPISAAACRKFSAAIGLGTDIHYPMYGLAEATVGVACPRRGGLETVQLLGEEVVSEGPVLDGIEIRVVDESGTVVESGSPGLLQVRGPNVTHGYLEDADATRELFDGDWLRTGDIGAVIDGHLAVIGRHKNVICIGGRNLHAHDVEEAAESVSGLRPGGAVAVADRRGDSEALVVLVRLDSDVPHAPILWEIRRWVAGRMGVPPDLVIPIQKMPRTTSGKKQRTQRARQLNRGDLEQVVGNTLMGVCGAWNAALGRELGAQDLDTSFQALGGGSLQAVALLENLDVLLGVLPDHRLLLRGHTIRQQALNVGEEPSSLATGFPQATNCTRRAGCERRGVPAPFCRQSGHLLAASQGGSNSHRASAP
jgi:acyl-CoA synthetase (AMP-forming)/AMP-acid ligase II